MTSQEYNKPLYYNYLFRDFLLELPAEVYRYPAGIKSRLEEYGVLPNFSALNEKNINWDAERRENVMEGDNLPAKYIPKPKRRKT